MPDIKKQELFDDILKAKRAINLLKVENNPQETESEPDLAFEPIKPDGSFSMLFDKKVTWIKLKICTIYRNNNFQL